MASRTKQKEEARARRLAEERALAERARQRRRLQMIGGVVLAAVAVVAVAIALSVGGGSSNNTAKSLNTPKAQSSVGSINSLLAGIPQSASTLGPPTAKVTVTEYGDLQCPVCKDFAQGAEQQLISQDVKQGRVRLVYKSLSTATGNGPDPGVFPSQQAAAYAAGSQNLAWYYILDFYKLQGQEDTSYVTPAFLNGIARLVPGLNFAKWSSDRNSSTLLQQVNAEQQTAHSLGLSSTPAILVQGPKGQAQPIVGAVDYGTLEQAIKLVS
jgi:protein-disulfide isomerase